MRIAQVIHVLMALLLFALPARAQMAPPKDALDGIDAVALLTQGKEITGKPEFKVTRGKFDYLFATAGNKATFEKNPEKYEIQLSGACARMGAGVTGNPNLTISDGTHPNADGYAIVVKTVMTSLEPLLKK